MSTQHIAAARRIAVVLFGPPGRGGFNQAGLAGAERARALVRAGAGVRADAHASANAGATADVQTGATTGTQTLEVHCCEPAAPSERADFLRTLLQPGAHGTSQKIGLLIAHGGQGDAPVAAVAPEFPGTHFAITQGNTLAPNIACYEVLQEQSAFLAGVLAAASTRSGVVAHMSGERVRPGLAGRAAFADGVRQQDPKVSLVTAFCGNQHDADLAYRVVCAQADAGADVLFAMIDGGRDGAIRACRERNIAQIGNVFDWTTREPDVFIASAIADSGHCIELAVQDFLAGKLACGQKKVIGLEAAEHVRLALHPRVSEAARTAVERYRVQLLSAALVPADEYAGAEFSFSP